MSNSCAPLTYVVYINIFLSQGVDIPYIVLSGYSNNYRNINTEEDSHGLIRPVSAWQFVVCD